MKYPEEETPAEKNIDEITVPDSEVNEERKDAEESVGKTELPPKTNTMVRKRVIRKTVPARKRKTAAVSKKADPIQAEKKEKIKPVKLTRAVKKLEKVIGKEEIINKGISSLNKKVKSLKEQLDKVKIGEKNTSRSAELKKELKESKKKLRENSKKLKDLKKKIVKREKKIKKLRKKS